ncbi:MAG: hypothetical protein H7841_05185 [Magnetospirillum sp. WYHS-4]
MSGSERASWPKKAGGTVDWEKVFEDPRDGLIPLISKARTAQALRQSTILVIQKLYTRKDDPPEVARFVGEVTSLIRDDLPVESLPRLVQGVTAILRQVKEERIRKAAEFEREKALEAEGKKKPEPAKDRRAPKKTKPDRRRMVIVGGAAVGVLLVAIVAYFVIAAPSLQDRIGPNMQLVEQMKAAAQQGHASGTNPFGGTLKVEQQSGRTAVTADGLPVDACMSVAWVLLNRGIIIVNGMTSHRIGPAVIKELCTRTDGPTATITWLPKATDKDDKDK